MRIKYTLLSKQSFFKTPTTIKLPILLSVGTTFDHTEGKYQVDKIEQDKGVTNVLCQRIYNQESKPIELHLPILYINGTPFIDGTEAYEDMEELLKFTSETKLIKGSQHKIHTIKYKQNQ